MARVQGAMISVFHQGKVFKPVVFLVEIDMMNNIAFWNCSMRENPYFLMEPDVLPFEGRHCVWMKDDIVYGLMINLLVLFRSRRSRM